MDRAGDSPVAVRPIREADRVWAAEVVGREFYSTMIYSALRWWDTTKLPALVAWRGTERCGIAHYRTDQKEWELVVLLALTPGQGIGTALLQSVIAKAKEARAPRLFLTTTNDNLPALDFYQRRGFRLVRIYSGAMLQARRIIPAMPEFGHRGIPLRDDLELELPLTAG